MMQTEGGYSASSEGGTSNGDNSNGLVCRWCGSDVAVTPSPYGGGLCASCRATQADAWSNIRTVRVP